MSAPAAPLQGWQEWPVEQKLILRAKLRHRIWRTRARADQLPPADPWQTLFYRGGRGSGKTWAGAHVFAEEILGDPRRTEGAWAIVAPTFADARDKCIESDESGLLVALGTSKAEVDAGRSPVVRTWNRSIGELFLHDGTRIVIDGADDGAYRIQGENLRGVWGDEVGLWKKWKDAFDESIGFALRKGRSRMVLTGTPKRNQPARKLIKRLMADPDVVVRQLLTRDNLANLSAAFKQAIKRFVGTELGRQELAGEMLEDAEGALWKRDWIDDLRVEEPPYAGWQRAPRMGVDPSDGTEDGAEHAYTVSALGMDHDLYVAEHGASRATPYDFACHCLERADAHGATIVLEKNHGGAWLVEVFERAMKDMKLHVPIKVIHAAQGKMTRAEPVASLYESRKLGGQVLPGRVHHIGMHDELEDQMCNWTGAAGEKSPDRLDSLVWSLSDFTDLSFGPPPPDDQDQAVPWDETPRAPGADLQDAAVAWR